VEGRHDFFVNLKIVKRHCDSVYQRTEEKK